MKKYKYKFPSSIVIVGIIGIVVAICCMAFGVYRFLNLLNENIKPSLYQYITFALTVLLPIFYMVIAVSAYFSSYYFVTETQVVLKWGVISNKFNLNDIKEVKLITNDSKLELIFKDDTYFLIATGKEWFDSFVDEIKTKKPNIPYIVHTDVSKN